MSKETDNEILKIINDAARFAGMNTGHQEFDDTEELFGSEEIIKQQKEEEKRGVKKKDDYTPGHTEIEEELHFQRFNAPRKHKYTEKEMEAIRTSCERTVVHDYAENDIFHMSDEKRQEVDMLNEIRPKLGSLKRMYRRADQYVEAMRVVIQAWEMLERNNFIHSKEEFYRLVAKGKIVSGSIIMPKFKGIEDYNIDTIIKYISNPDIDASTLRPKEIQVEDKWYDRYTDDFEEDPEYQQIRLNIEEEWKNAGRIPEEELPEDATDEQKAMSYKENDLDQAALDEMETRKMERLLDDEEIAWVNEHSEHPGKMEVHPLERKYIKGYDMHSSALTTKKKKKKKKLSKGEKRIREATHQMLNIIQQNANQRGGVTYGRSYLIANGLFDTEKEEVSVWEKMRFQGSFADKTAVFLNDLADQEILGQERAGASHGYATYADLELQRFFEVAEQNGINVLELRRRMNCTDDDVKTRNDKQSRKRNRKIEAALVHRLAKLNRDPKFKKVIAKAEKEVNESYEDH